MSKVSILFPSLWNPRRLADFHIDLLTCVKTLNLQNQVELVFSCQGQKIEQQILPEIEGVIWSFPKTFGYTRNLAHCLELASGDCCLIMGQDDKIPTGTLLHLLQEIDDLRCQNKGPVSSLPLVLVAINGYSNLPRSPKLGQVFMRLGSSPGVCITNAEAARADLQEYESIFPNGIYPQVWIGLKNFLRGGAIALKPHILVDPGGSAWERAQDAFNRPPDYGAAERVEQLYLLLKNRSRSLRYEGHRALINLSIWLVGVAEEISEEKEKSQTNSFLADLRVHYASQLPYPHRLLFFFVWFVKGLPGI